MQLSRRRFLALSASIGLGACASSDGDEAASPSASTEPSGSSTTASPTTAPPATSTTTTDAPAATTTTEPEPDGIHLDVDPFTFGVASGDPDATSVVIWTRLDGDLPADGIDVAWAYAPDSGSGAIEGVVRTDASLGGSVHVIVETDSPGIFKFSAGGWKSPAGTTAPIDPTTSEFRIAAASCQNYESGFYAAHRDIAEWRPDLVVFLGDFIYEGFSPALSDTIVRLHDPFEPVDLDGYRARYAQYLRDPQLQASRAAAPWLAIWDDHEVENNYAGLVSEDDADPAEFAVRRSQAYQAWWENTPTRLPPPDLADPTTPYPIHRGLDVGELLRISALDGRQFRDDQLSDVILDPGPPVDGWDDPGRSMLGAEQEAWAIERFATSEATWNCLAQQTVFGDTRLGDVGAILNYDQWDGYAAARDRLLAAAPSNFVTITGDIHLAGVGEIFDAAGTHGIEFVTTGISSGQNVDPALVDVVKSIPAIVDAELEFRGYTRHTISPTTWRAEYRQVVEIGDPDSDVRTWKTFEVPAGSPTVTEADV
ncbi:alkaline phosphatase D family protein [Ilumatobacter coccineus]|uniref:Putative alkaline phosphatase n=1 Tax=Ilumatobacter coccineus (strain NBRC 103263 / KCTC 29153 / YM16-304) TaxID=1313172 RepID=A0A6C7E9I6_ILUCY|nr:alkaline phosphatase D family protein [Ilumatobacter coccineus]BAN03377.1 putative alkaline phosphatase [Ilumatobacter coccineus YM16-304]